MVIISAPKLLRKKPGEEGSEALIDIINKSHEKNHPFETPLGNFKYRLIKPTLLFGYQLKEC